MAGNLTRDEARERARILDVTSYDVELDLTGGDQTFASTTVIRFDSSEPGARTFVDLVAPRVRSVELNGRALDPAEVVADGRIALPELAASNELRVVADAAYMRTGEGLHRFVDPVDGNAYLYTQFETADAHRMYACFDQPDLKATFELTVLAPADFEVVSNTAPDAVREPVADADRPKARWHFPPTKPLSTYVTALIAGPYHAVRDEHDGIPLGVYCRASLAEHLDADAILEVTKQGFDFYHGLFDLRYPFEKYDQLFVPEFNAGAMENAGAVTFLEDYVFRSRVTDARYERRAETILHEMAHMWFGDLVTMRWWDDLWLNESFATFASVYCQAEATRWQDAWTTFANVEKAWALRQDQLPSTHPIAADIPDMQAVEVNFDGITYAKGASVLKQLVAYVGVDAFFAGVRAYFAEHAWGNTELGDLLRQLEAASGRDLSTWSREWLETAGVNTMRPEFTVGEDGAFTSFAVLQEAAPEHPTLRSHRLAIGLYDRTSDGIVRRERVELDVAGERTEVPQLVGHAQPDLVLVNDDDLTFTKIRLDERSLRTVIESIGDIRGSLPRALGFSAAWDMTRDAEMAARDYVSLVISGIGGVTDVSVAQMLLRQAVSALYNYADPKSRDAGFARLADRLRDLLTAAEPGSDLQLVYAQGFADAAVSGEHLSLLQGLLDGAITVEGLAIDTDLRWTLLRRLVARGQAGEAEIAAELESDPTAAGERSAAGCRAAIPTVEAKALTWDRLRSAEKMANAEFRATLLGFSEPAHAELLRPYRDRYFALVGEAWRNWTGEFAQTFAELAYPGSLIEEETLRATDAYIEQERPAPALRRLLIEGRAGVERALRARAKDAAAG
ncbi:aminopeptidase N [Marinitenerispora sediminis]|uniref:Aminopeptidase N n=1 Tax=Marinitenerispora sediminis TaxID=1931232 RepID=A0A368T9T9_9ACTN|nr:aminopeptidase N [Marinitenerispora sediminis]RCV53819.1 aminopeptidase N [Marinitenerispora sediminis]RCV58219.1 aminopeptidase N [Marinitenerispora sediminis]RCV61485.1 aminopeptidase N [Marinitenerispora sediminis]